MNDTIYLSLLLISSGIIFFLGIQLLFGPIPEDLKDRPYNISRRLMGLAQCLLPIILAVLAITGIYWQNKNIVHAANLCGYYPASALIHISLLALLGMQINLKSNRFKLYVLSFLLLPIILYFGGSLLGVRKAVTIGNTFLCICIGTQFIHLYRRYKTAIIKNSHKYFNEIAIHTKWIGKIRGVYAILGVVACLAPALDHPSQWWSIIVIIIPLTIFIYFYESYHKFVSLYLKVNHIDEPALEIAAEEAVLEEQEEEIDEEKRLNEEIKKVTLSPEVQQHITKRINHWVAKRGYCKSGITIQSTAIELLTNRTYLSIYINKEYGCSFRSWVTTLKINEAKRLLLTNQEYTIVKIARKTGFPSQTSFIHVFHRQVGSSPAKWRAQNSELPTLSTPQTED